MLLRFCLFILLVLYAARCAAGTQVPGAPGAGRHFYLDCSLPQNGSGQSQLSAWNSVAALNATPLRAGDVIALRRGTTCHGSLAPQGSGTADAPIRLTAWGEGSRPKIVAPPDAANALRLFNQQNWDIDSLDIAGGRTNGVFISGDNGVLHHIHLANLAVHGVMGGEMKHKESGLVAISPVSAACHFDDVLIDNVMAWHTNQWVGILVGGGDLGYPPESDWSSSVVIRNSVVHDVQGDGIVLFRVRHGMIESSVAWDTGMQNTESIGTPNAIWTWMCDDCTVRDNEAYLTDSPGVDGGAYDIDYGNTRNSVLDNYGHDTQGYCVAVFGAGFVTKDSLVRGNLCINNGRSPRMADYQGAIFLYTWNGGSIDGLTIDHNTILWSPFNNAPALLNNATITAGTPVFRENRIESTAPWLLDSNPSLSLSENHYRYYGAGHPQWRYGTQSFDSLSGVESATHQEANSTFEQSPLGDWPPAHAPRPSEHKLTCTLPVTLDAQGLLGDEALRQIVGLRNFAHQYRAKHLEVSLNLTAPDPAIFATPAYRNALLDLDLQGITLAHSVATGPERTDFSGGVGHVRWDGFAGPAGLGFMLRRDLGEPVYTQMGFRDDDN